MYLYKCTNNVVMYLYKCTNNVLICTIINDQEVPAGPCHDPEEASSQSVEEKENETSHGPAGTVLQDVVAAPVTDSLCHCRKV